MKRFRQQENRFADWWRGKRHRARLLILLIPLITVLLLGGVYMGARALALNSADHLTIAIVQVSPGPVRTVYQQTFGRSLAAEAEHLLNDTTTAVWSWPFTMIVQQPTYGVVLTGAQVDWVYHLTFTWHGMVVEATDTAYDHEPESYTVSGLGLSDAWVRLGGNIIPQLAGDSSGAIPLPPSPN